MQKLDLLMNLVGELMIDKSRFDLIEHKIEAGEELTSLARDLRDATGSMGRITDQLHTAIMDTRMVTIGSLFNRFPRVVRELARGKGQEIELVVSGEETEIDKAIIEEINDPLVHLIRNAADHGIESPGERRQAGKPEQGTVFLRASHEGGNVVIEVEDDGKGMDVQLIKDKAVRNGIITKEQAEHMQTQEALNLIFLPGFSTKEVVTDISGRGVGMDVVKTNIEKLRGKVLVQTELHKGSKIVLKLPLTMAIIETLMVKAGDEIFAIPILAVNAVSEVKQSDLQFIQGEMAVRLHDRTIGVVHLCDVFDIPRKESGKKIYLVVLEVKNSKGKDTEMGFIVDAVHDKQKIVIKPLDDSTVDMSGFSGVTILGDGRVALIIDPVELIDKLVMERGKAGEIKQEIK
jgi:two-component system chemotaxis sensor kinase CheA